MAFLSWLKQLKNTWIGSSRGKQGRRQRGRRYASPLAVEQLEARLTPSGYTVTNTSSSSSTVGSLPYAVAQAGSDTSGTAYTINFDAGAFATPRTIALAATLSLNNTTAGESIIILGPTATLTIEGGLGSLTSFSDFTVASHTTATLENLAITGGYTTSNGGGITNSGTLTVSNSILSGNSAVDNGGGIYNRGTLTVTESTLSGNSAAGAASKDGGGGIYNGDDAELTVSDSTLSSNTASGAGEYDGGGGIYNYDDATAIVSFSTLADNTASGSGTDVGGGGIYNYDDATLTVSNSTLAANTASGSGANDGGGGIYNYDSGTVTVTNSTLFGNSAVADGGGIYNFNSATTNLSDSTLSGNSASVGGGISNDSSYSDQTISGSIVAGNEASSSGPDISGGIKTDDGYNLFGTAVDNHTNDPTPGPGDVFSNTPMLAPLGNYGGPTETMSLLPGSPAIGAGVTISGITIDQRGISRPADPDIGAVQEEGFAVSINSSGGPQTTAVGQPYAAPLVVTVASAYGEPVAGGVVTFTVPNGGASATLSSITAVVNSNGQASVTAVANDTAGAYSVTASASGLLPTVTFNLTNSPASPTMTTTPNVTVVTLGASQVTLTDTADLEGGSSPTGTITFTLYQGSTLVDTETAAVSGNGFYTTPAGYTLPTTGTATGIYQWDASYTGDSNNNNVSDPNADDDQVTVNPAISLTPSLPADTINVPYNRTISASGGTGAVALTVSDIQGAIPGLTIPPSGTGSLNITGTPTASGTVTFMLTATDSLGVTTGAVPYAIQVAPSPAAANFVQAPGSPISLPNNFEAFSVTTADLNGNGIQDVIVGDGNSPIVGILMGNGNGTFQALPTVSEPGATGGTYSVAAADLTNDGGAGLPDIVTTNTGTVTVLQNTTATIGATPTFTPVTVATGLSQNPQPVITGDFSGDGLQDIAFINFNQNTITILPNTSTGPGVISFGSPIIINLPSSSDPRDLIAADIYGNGKLDLITANQNGNTVTIYQNTSTGPGNISFTLGATISLPSGSEPNAVAAGDFVNGSSLPDLVVTSFASDSTTAYVILNQGNGNFSAPTAVSLGSPGLYTPQSVTTGDFTGNGDVDIAVSGMSGELSVLYGNGAGAFPTLETYPIGPGAGGEPRWITTADVNGDGAPDLVLSNQNGDGASVFLNQTEASTLQVSPATTAPDAGTNFNVTVTAQSLGATYQNYNGTVTLTATDAWGNVTSLGTHTFDSSDAGSYAFTISLPNAGEYTLTATDSALAGTNQLTVVQPPTVPQALPADTIGVAYNQTITPSGGAAPYTLAVSNVQNPIPGLIVPSTDGGTSVLTISGTPLAAGTEIFTVTTTDSLNNTTTTTYSITVNPGVVLGPPSLATDTINASYDSTISASGGTGPITLNVTSVANAIPDLVISPNGSTVSITGIPTAAGTETFTVTATDSLGAATSTNYSITVNPAIAFNQSTLPADTINRPYNQTISVASGGTGAIALKITSLGTLAGLTVTNNGTNITITGTPTATGTLSFTVTATDADDASTVVSYSVKVNAAPTLSTLTTLPFTAGVAFNQTITASNGTAPLSLAASIDSGSIPGLNLPLSGAGSLNITGTPTAAGTETFTVTVTDAAGATTSANYSITVRNPVPTLSDVGFTAAVDEGSPATLTGTITAPANEPLTLDVNWGDGSATQTYDLPAGTTTFSESYLYSSTGSYSVNASVGDSDYSNDLLYASTGGTSPNPGQLAVVDLQNDAVTVVGNLLQENVTEIAANTSTGQDWLELGANDFEGEQFNINTGAAVGSLISNATHENFNAMTYIGGTLYATGTPATGGTSPSSLYTLNPATGTATLIGATGINGPISGIAYDSANSTLYGIEGGTSTPLSLVSINLTTGVATPLFTTGFMAGSLSYAPDGNLYAGSSTGEIYLVNPAAQTVTPFVATGYTGAISGLTLGNDTASVQTTVNPAITLSSTTQALFVTSYVTNAVYEIDASTGALLKTLVAPNSQSILMGPAGITVGPDGNLYITGEGYDGSSFTGPYNIVEYNFSTQTLSTFITGAQMQAANGGVPFAPGGIAFGPDGNLYTDNTLPGAGADQVIRFGITNNDGQLSYNGTNTTIATGLSVACDITFGVNPGDQGNLYVSDDNSVLKITGATTNAPTSSLFVSPGSGGLTYSCGLTWQGGNLYDTDPGSGQVLEYSATGSFLGDFTGSALQDPNQQPINTLFLPDGDVVTSTFGPGSGFLVSSQGNEAGALMFFNSSGQILQNLGAGAFPANAAGVTNVALAFMTLDTTAPAAESTVVLAQGTVNAPYNQTITPNGGTGAVTLTVNVTNAINGLNITGSGTSSLSITGPPTATGTETFTVTATDAAGGTTTTTYSITVNPAPTLGPTTLPADTINVAYNQTITATGGTGNVMLTVGAISNPIAGLSVAGTGTGVLSISGTPTASGTETFTVTATDGVGATTTITYSVTVNLAIVLGPASLPNGAVGTAYDQTISAGGAENAFYANQVVSYNPGTLFDPSYDDPSAALGGLDPVAGSFAGTNYYLTPFDPAFEPSNLVEIGAGGSLVLKLAQTASTDGYTIGVQTGFGLLDNDYPSGVNSNPASYINSWLRQADVLVSADGVNWGNLGTVTFDNPSNYDTGAATDPEGGSPGVGSAADPGKPFLGNLNSFNGENWQQTLATLNGSAGGTWLNLSGVTDENGNPITGVNYIEFVVPNNPPTDPNTGNPEIMMVDAVVGISGTPSGGTGAVQLAVSNVQNAIAGLNVPASGTGSLNITGTPTASGTETFTVTATDAVGATTSTTYSITVPPTLSISGSASIDEQATYTLDLSGIDGSPNSISDWAINWGDGDVQTVTGNPSAATHVYAEGPNDYTISATATDNIGTYAASDTVAVAVDHVPPVLSISGAGMANNGSVYTLNLSGSEPVAPHTISQWTINWGDGSAPQIVAGNALSVTHVFPIAAKVTISASATDDVGTYAAADTVAVVVTNWSEPALAISGAASVNEGAVYTLALLGQPVAGQPILQWSINWGDGAVQTVTGNPTKVTHVYAIGPNSYTISATATDDTGTYAVAKTVSVAVKHVAPVVTFSGAASVNEGAVYTLTLAGQDTHIITEWTINWGDGSPLQIALGNPTSVTHVYAAGPHNYTISASATDDVGTYRAVNTLTVAVKHVPPVLAIYGPAEIAQGSTYTLDLSATVTADHAVAKWVINWGDGSPLQTVTGDPSSVTHIYLAGPSTHVIHASAVDNVGAYGAGNTVTVMVDHVAPTLTLSGAASVNEKAPYTLDLAASAPGTVAIEKWTILWGDGTVQTVLGNPKEVTHVYAVGPNNYTIMATATDPEGTYAALSPVSVMVNHVPPTLAISGAATVNEGATYTLKLSGVDTHPISQWTINWGDGTIQTVTGNPKQVTHVYAVGPNSYTISASATDGVGSYNAPTNVTVNVKHVLPVVTFSGAANVNEGAAYTLTLSGKDSHAITQWTINWGDGSPLQIATGNPTSVTHVYADGPHTYIISASATDDVGTYQVANTLSVAVKHVPPALTISGAAQIAQGSTYTLNLSAVVTGTHAISKWFINWGDGSPVQTVTGNPSSVTHVYLAGPATHTIHASAEDDVGAYSAGNTVTVTVAHVAPTLTISGAASVNEKALYTLDLFSSSPGTLSIKKWTIVWGDGTVQTVIGNPAQVTHVYAVGPNTYTIMATATDPEGTYAALNTVNVSVNHVAPTLTISGRTTVAVGSVYTLDLSGVDTHPISQWTINWGDGTIQTVTGNPRKVTHVYATGGGAAYVISAVAADDINTYYAGDTVQVTVTG